MTAEQEQVTAWPELRIGDVRPDTSFFPRYWMNHFSGKPWSHLRDLREEGSFTTVENYHGLFMGDHAFVALAGPKVTIWDAFRGNTPPDSRDGAEVTAITVVSQGSKRIKFQHNVGVHSSRSDHFMTGKIIPRRMIRWQKAKNSSVGMLATTRAAMTRLMRWAA